MTECKRSKMLKHIDFVKKMLYNVTNKQNLMFIENKKCKELGGLCRRNQSWKLW